MYSLTKHSVCYGSSSSVFKSAMKTEYVSGMQKKEMINKRFLKHEQNKKTIFSNLSVNTPPSVISNENPLNLVFQ